MKKSKVTCEMCCGSGGDSIHNGAAGSHRNVGVK